MKYVKRLSLSEKSALNDLLRHSASHRLRFRAHAIILSSKKYKINDLSSIFFVDRDTITDWIKRWEQSGINGLIDRKRSGRPKKDQENKKEDEN